MADPTLELLKAGMALTNVAAAVISTASKAYLCKTASEVGIKGRVDSGKKTPLRKGNKLLAQNNTEDLLLGYDIDLTDLLCNPEVVAIVDGGTVVNSEDGVFQSYSAPVAGQETVRTRFTLDIYCENRDTGNNVVGYQKMSFPGCVGKTAVEWSMKDGEFFNPKLSIENAPAVGESPMSMEIVSALPTVTGA